ncbi:hypothetical protein NPIL_240531 [Nephila pilipes]|uniref:Uncharacterized protein n=1 Tax=Nephila pilipes TaxID=299642 RepID=A0A8X6N8A0_NEPPI|nr:hypothetical protein NPIL_240531 [Nephila pilipes]
MFSEKESAETVRCYVHNTRFHEVYLPATDDIHFDSLPVRKNRRMGKGCKDESESYSVATSEMPSSCSRRHCREDRQHNDPAGNRHLRSGY